MVRVMLCAALAAALSPAPVQAQAGAEAAEIPSAPIPPGAQPDLAQLEGALLAHNRRIAAHPMACRKGPLCIKPARAMKVRNYDCQARGSDSKGADILYCRVTYVHKGGSLSGVKSPNECVPLRATRAIGLDSAGAGLAWQVALVDEKGKCPGARH